MMKACKEGHLDVTAYLLEAQLAQKKKAGPLGGGDSAKALATERKRALDAKDDEGVTALMKAAEAGELDICRLLLEDGATADLKDDEGWNSLMWAALSGQIDICEMLIRDYSLTADYCTE